jgi:putative two-component system response regulator
VKKQILIIDDDQRVLDALRRTLHEYSSDWSVTFVRQSETAWEHLLDTAYDAVVTDVKMPGVSGFDLLERIRQRDQTRTVPVVILTGLNDQELKTRALNLGAADLLNKPVEPAQLIARLRNVLQLKAYQDDLHANNERLAETIRRQAADLAQSRLDVVHRLGIAAEFRDGDTGNHVIRVGCFSRAIAAALNMHQSFLEMLLMAAPLHDIGKIGIPDSVLLKSGPLSDDEWTIMQRHCEIGERILRERSRSAVPSFDWCVAEADSPSDAVEHRDPMLEMAAVIALTHHEKWDGSGYPQGLAREDIPLESRIVSVADVFDALTSDRPYRISRPDDETLTIIDSSVGSHFDAQVHSAFLRALPEICAIRARFNDDAAVMPELEGASL